MGHGRIPGSETAAPPDPGTSATTLSPTPGATGLDSRDAPPPPAAAALTDAVVAFARRSRGKKVGDGECFALAHRALRKAGAKSAEDFGTVTPTADYTWGTSVSLANVKPGDIVQFRDYRYHQRIDTVTSAGSKWEERSEERPHHTAIVELVGASGAVTVLEQNAPEGSAVRRTQLYFSTATTRDGGTTTTTTVEGSVRFYRPQAR